MRILMVCLGNICRSPLAEGILKHLAEENNLDWQVDSAGTNGYHTGEAPHPLSQKVAKLNGIDISKQVSRKFKREDIGKYDIIYAMANDVLLDINQIAENNSSSSNVKLFMQDVDGSFTDVPDPWYGTEPGYHEVYDMLYKGCKVLIEKYR